MRVCCVDERDGTGTGGEPSGRIKSGGNSTRAGASRAVLSELLGGVEGEQVQVELSAVRVLFELFGFLLSGNERYGSCAGEPVVLTQGAISVYNVQELNFLIIMRRTRWNARLARFGKAD